MNNQGLAFCSRFSYPPNSLSLCGPQKQNDLAWYTTTLQVDKGTQEILTQFGTAYPYLVLIAYENDIRDPFDLRVVEAYWLGNNLLSNVKMHPFVKHLSAKLSLKKRLKKPQLDQVFTKIGKGALPHHSFHVLNIYKRTGLVDTPHTLQTMDACIINWGQILSISKNKITVSTKPLTISSDRLCFGLSRKRMLLTQGANDILAKDLRLGDWVSYHWGYFCQKLNPHQLKNLIYYTNLSIQFANGLS